jgi:predicted ATPase
MVDRIENDRLFVITGGPGSGKTTLLRELAQRGFSCSEEVARQIIQEQVKANGDALPWGDTLHYTELMLARSIDAFREHTPSSRIIFMDRGIPDVACYARLIDLPFFDELRRACETYRYNTMVFMAPAWEEIYTTDSERKQTYEEAIDTHQLMVAVYEEYGYQPIELPRVAPAERAEFVMALISRLFDRSPTA